MNNFVISSKAQILFGEGISSQTGNQLISLNCKKVLFIYDEGIKNSDILNKIVKTVEDKGISIVHFEGVLPDP